MDAKALATALVSEHRSESEKLRLIRKAFPVTGSHLSAADVSYVQQQLAADRRLAKLSLEFADASRNREFALAELFSANTVTPGHVATRFHWLYTRDVLVNENFLINELTKMSHSTRLKVLYAIGANVNDLELGDQLWKVVREHYSLRYSNRLLAACSNELIIREMTASRSVQLTDAQMLQILHKRFDSGVELLRELRLPNKEKDLKQNVDFENAMHYVLLKNFERGFNILVETQMSLNLGAKRTRSLLKALADGGDSDAVKERIVKYADRLHQNTLRKYAPKDLYLRCFLEKNKHFNPDDDYGIDKVMASLKGLHKSEKRPFLEALYQKRYKKSLMDVPMKIAPEMLYLLDEDEWTSIVRRRIEKKDYSLARHYGAEPGDIFWRAMLPCKVSFPDLKGLLATERTADGRGIIYSLMIKSAIMQHDSKALEEHLKFVVTRCRNETSGVQDSIITIINKYYENDDRIRANVWPSVKEFFETMLIGKSTQHWAMFDVLFGVLKSIDPKDREAMKDFAAIFSKAHLNHKSSWPYSFADDFKKVPQHDCGLIVKQILSDQEAYLEKKQKNNYTDTSNIWRAFATVQGLKLKVDFSQYPNNLDFLKYLISPEEKDDYYMNDSATLTDAYKLIKDYIDKDFPLRSKIRTEASTDFETVSRRIRKNKDVSKIELRTILDDRHSKIAFLYQLSKLLAACNAITPATIEEALQLADDDDHRTAATQFLAMCMPLDEFMAHFGKYIPTDGKINPAEIDPDLLSAQKALIGSAKALTDSATGLKILAGFMQGDYLKMAVGAFNYFCARSPPEIVLPFLEDNITDSPVSVQKHFLRWFFVYAADSNAKLSEVIATAKNGSTKLEVLKIVYRKVEDCGAEAWPILKSCLERIRQEDRQVMDFLFRDDSIDDRLGDHLVDFFRTIFALGDNLPEKQKDSFDYFYSRGCDNLTKLPQDLAQAICTRAMDQELSNDYRAAHARAFVEQFALHNVPVNVDFVSNEFLTRLQNCTEFAETNLRVLARTLSTAAVCRKRNSGGGTTSPPPQVLQTLHRLLTSHVDRFVAQQVFVELALIAIELVPAKDADDAAMARAIGEYTSRSLALLCQRLDQLGDQMFGVFSPLLVDVIETVIGDCSMHRGRMIEVFRSDSPTRYAWFLIECLPSRKAENYADDESVYEDFIGAITNGTNLPLKMMLNIKLNSLGREDP